MSLRRPDLPWFPGATGNALNWTASARRRHIPTGKTPAVGAVAVFAPGQYQAGKYGHVAYITAVDVSGGKITISEYNFRGRKVDIRTIPWAGLTFIYLPTITLPPKKPEIPELIVPPIDRTAITNIDGTRGDLAPYSGEFTIADQPFATSSDTITYAGVTVGNPNVPPGLSSSDTIELRICEKPDCSSMVLASTSAVVNNYGLTTAEFADVPVTLGATYYLVWTPPGNAHGSHWLTFWHGGGPFVSESQSMEAIIRGYDHGWKGPNPGPREIISYAGTTPPPVPYSGPFVYAYQNFKAASDTITRLGIVVGNPELARLAEGPDKILVRLCETPDCSSGVLAIATPYIVNYGRTEVDIGDVAVTPGRTYFINWTSPQKIGTQSWVTFWLGKGPLPEEADLMQAFARGYNRSPSQDTVGPHILEQVGYLGAPTFKNPVIATGAGARIEPLAEVEVTCKLYAPQIESSEPDGYWYRIHSAPWKDEYYAVANTFWNGIKPGSSGETINTDLRVPDC